MFTAILADDEPMILKGLEKLIDWKALDIKILGTAVDGSEAMSLIEKHNPDILISDISMPNLSGIELLKQLGNKSDPPKVIFISGYQEFEYARDALKFGAVDYLLKPINEKQLTLALKSIIAEKLEESGQKQQMTLQLNIENTEQSEIVDFDLIGAKQHIIDTESFFCVLCCGFDENEVGNNDDFEITMFSTMNQIEQLVEPIKGHWLFHKNKNIYILIYDEEKSEVETWISTLPIEIINTIDRVLDLSISVSLGKTVKDINQIKETYQIAKEGIDLNYFYGKSTVINYKGVHRYKYNLEDYYAAQVGILDSIMSYEKDKITKAVIYYMDIVKDVSLWDKKSAINYSLATVVFIRRHIKDSAIELENNNVNDIKDALDLTCYYDEMVIEMTQYFHNILSEIALFVSVNEVSEINKVKIYIQNHFSEVIKLETLAELVFMNPNYFSGYFKKHVGIKFKTYLTNIRINEAEKIMLSTDKKIYEVAEAVGFSDYRHFSEVFKKIKGDSPSDYKKKLSKLK